MRRNQTEIAYRKAAIQNASSVGLVIILYDMLIADVQSVIEAIEQRNIEKRVTELKHGFLVLQELEGLLDLEKAGVAAKNLARFYSVVRAKLLEAHAQGSEEMFRRQIDLLLQVRQAWEQVNTPAVAVSQATPTMESSSESNGDRAGSGWSA